MVQCHKQTGTENATAGTRVNQYFLNEKIYFISTVFDLICLYTKLKQFFFLLRVELWNIILESD